MLKSKPSYKRRLHELELYKIALIRLRACKGSKYGIISFPDVFLTICRGFSIDKQTAWHVLSELKNKGYIQIIATKGVIIYDWT